MQTTKPSKKCSLTTTVLCEDQALADDRRVLALKICAALTVHTQIEEEIFYPAVRDVIGDDALMQEALQEHAQAKDHHADQKDGRRRHGL